MTGVRHGMADKANSGGDIYFDTGRGQAGDAALGTLNGDPGDFIFRLGGAREVLRIKGDGTFIIRGEKVGYAKDAYDAFLEWLKSARVKHHATSVTGQSTSGACVVSSEPSASEMQESAGLFWRKLRETYSKKRQVSTGTEACNAADLSDECKSDKNFKGLFCNGCHQTACTNSKG